MHFRVLKASYRFNNCAIAYVYCACILHKCLLYYNNVCVLVTHLQFTDKTWSTLSEVASVISRTRYLCRFQRQTEPSAAQEAMLREEGERESVASGWNTIAPARSL